MVGQGDQGVGRTNRVSVSKNSQSCSLHRSFAPYTRQMKRPNEGDELTIRYQGATFSEKCGPVTEIEKRAPGATRFTIMSKGTFHSGGEAALVDGANELPLRVERVTSMPEKRANLVSLYGVFEMEEAAG